MSEQDIEEPDIDEGVEAAEVIESASDEADIQPDVPQKAWSDDDEAEARAFGWKSPDEWQGRVPEGFIEDPRQYVERAMTFRPFRTLKERLDQTERGYEDRLRKLETLNQRALDMQRQQYEARLEGIRQQKMQAVDMADKDQYARLDQEERRTQQAMWQTMQPPQSAPQPDPWVVQYAETPEGSWVKDTTLRTVGASLIDANPQIKAAPAEQQVKWVEAELKRLYPHEFAEPEAPKVRQTVDSGGLAGGKAGDSFSKLPKEARDVFHRYVKEGVVEDTKSARAEWAETYNAA